MNIAAYPITVSRVVALLILIASFVLFLMGMLPATLALLIGGLAFAMLVP